MIKIGYDDEWNPEDQVRDKTPIEGQRRKFDNKDVYLSERTQKKLLAEYDSVVVNDYGDDYHIPEDELKARNKYYEAFAKLSKMKRKYKRLDEFVIAMRQSLYCLDMVAKDNFLYDPEEFKKKWLDGKIEVFGLHHIVYKGKDRSLPPPYPTRIGNGRACSNLPVVSFSLSSYFSHFSFFFLYF